MIAESDFHNIPDDLKELPQWVVADEDKCPHDPRNGHKAKPNDSATWGSYLEAISAFKTGKWVSIGFVFTSDDWFTGVDLDNCRDPLTGVIKPWALEIVERLPTYWEVSRSGTGLHGICTTTLDISRKMSYQGGKIEVYTKTRYFIMTGNHLPSTPTLTCDCEDELWQFCEKHFGNNLAAATSSDHTWPTRAVDLLTDDDIIHMARMSKNGDKFESLFDDGDTAAYDDDDSRADLALCGMLAFWAGADGHGQVDRIFRRSALMRKKWDRPTGDSDYGRLTVLKAYQDRDSFYSPSRQMIRNDEDTTTLPADFENPFLTGMIRASELGDPVPPERLFFAFYRSSLVLLNGETGIGKSTLLYELCVHAALNEPLWGHQFEPGRPLNIFYIDPENGGNLTKTKLQRIGKGRPHNLIFHGGIDVSLNARQQIECLRQVIEQESIDLVILDPIANLFSTRDENDNAEAARQMKMLTSLTRLTGVCIVAVHHLGKNTSDNYGRGASARLAAADVGIMFRSSGDRGEQDDTFNGTFVERDEQVRLQVIKNRLEGRSSLYLQMMGQDQFDKSSYETWRSKKSQEGGKEEDAAEMILKVLDDGQEHERKDFEEAFKREGIGLNRISQVLKELVEEGSVEKRTGGRNKGFYRIPDEPV